MKQRVKDNITNIVLLHTITTCHLRKKMKYINSEYCETHIYFKLNIKWRRFFESK